MNNIKQRNLNDDWGNSFINFTGPGTKKGLLNMMEQVNLLSHRSGWNLVNNILAPLHNTNAPIFDGFIEKNFAWFYNKEKRNKNIPRETPWVGVLHNPCNMPEWFNYSASPQQMFKLSEFVDSLEHCKLIITLSEYLSVWVKRVLPTVDVHTVYHPGDIPKTEFNFDSFIYNQNKQIIAIGWWLRKLTSIYSLPVYQTRSRFGGGSTIYKKTWTIPYKHKSRPLEQMIKPLLVTEQGLLNISDRTLNKYPVNHEYCLSHIDYDILLSKNIAFLDMWDSSANNTIIECLMRGTPLICCKHPAVFEYLGTDYPLYFDTLEHAMLLSQDIALLEHTSRYMKARRKQFLPNIFYDKIKNLMT
jgi:hypothetical protein